MYFDDDHCNQYDNLLFIIIMNMIITIIIIIRIISKITLQRRY